MRVIAGRFRGLRLEAPPGDRTRPMTDRVKETVFNILGSRLATPGTLPPCEVLDLFAGSGALGLEALSRGAVQCTFVERNRQSVTILRRNIATTRAHGCCRVVPENVWTVRLPRAGDIAGYGLAFFDPPFRDVEDQLKIVDTLERVALRLCPGGVVLFRHDTQTEFDEAAVTGLTLVDERVLGRNRILVLERPEPAEAP